LAHDVLSGLQSVTLNVLSISAEQSVEVAAGEGERLGVDLVVNVDVLRIAIGPISWPERTG
jgi:hypothetical protein